MEYGSHLAELLVSLEYIASNPMKMLRFEKGLAPYLRNQREDNLCAIHLGIV